MARWWPPADSGVDAQPERPILVRHRPLWATVMALSVVSVMVLNWKDIRSDAGPGPSISVAGAGRALALSIVIEQAGGLRRALYTLAWPDPKHIRQEILASLLESLPRAKDSAERVRNLRIAAMVAAGELEEHVELGIAIPRSIQRAYPTVWRPQRSSEAVSDDVVNGWLELVLRYRIDGGGTSVLEAAQLYLDRTTVATLAIWVLAAASVPLLLLLRHKTVTAKADSAVMLFWWLQVLCLFAVGDELIERIAVESGGPFRLWAGARAAVFAAAALLGLQRMKAAGLVSEGSLASTVIWSAVAVGLMVICVELTGATSGDLPAVLYQRATSTWPGTDLLLLAGFSVVLTPLVEEILFRGLLLPGIRGLLGSAGAIGISALAFAAFHVGTAERIFFTLMIGVALGIVRERSGAVAPCILGHSVVNLWWWSRDWMIGFAGG